MKEKVLPISYPIVDCYPATSGAMAILQTREELSDWFLNSFIQLFEVRDQAIDFYDFSIENNPFLIYNEIDFTLLKKWENVGNFIKDSIDREYYVRLFINCKDCALYGMINYDFYHDILIYGYDEDNFYVADHFKDGKFSFQLMSIDELIHTYDIETQPKKIQDRHQHANLIQLIKPEIDLYRLQMDFILNSPEEKHSLFALDCNRIKLSCEDYLNSKPTTGWYTRIRGLNEVIIRNREWGINCFKTLKKHIQFLNGDSFYENSMFSLQSTYVECLHKKIMLMRVKLLTERKLLINGEVHQEALHMLCDEMNLLLLKFIKAYYKKGHKNVGINKLNEAIDKIVLDEERIITNIIKDVIV